MSKIFIYSGPVKTGKTTRLMRWASSQKHVDGIFQPVIENKRFIYHISSRTLKKLESDHTEDTTSIGNYVFSNKTFEWAKIVLQKCAIKDFEYLIVDEVGPLEFEGKGLEPSITELLKNEKKISSKIIFVVRENLLEKFVKHYHLEEKHKIFEL